ncbi:hypothetical protein PHYSODRAFT_459122, partial [Phytophthora sojae]
LIGIRHFFLASGRSFPSDHPQIRMFLKGISRLDGPPGRKAPVCLHEPGRASASYPRP